MFCLTHEVERVVRRGVPKVPQSDPVSPSSDLHGNTLPSECVCVRTDPTQSSKICDCAMHGKSQVSSSAFPFFPFISFFSLNRLNFV